MLGSILVAGFLLFVLSGSDASELTVQNSSSATDVRMFDYDMCPRGAVFSDQQLTTAKTRSRLECANRCSSTVGCEAFNVCPDDLPGAFTCHLLSDRNPQGCDGLTAAPSSDCRYAAKELQELQELICQNGGTSNGTHCKCPPEFSGTWCERLIWAVYVKVSVVCRFTGYSPTRVFVRTTNMSFDVDWATAKAGFDDPHDTSRKGDFFIGLENLHIFTQQFRYWNKMNMNHDGGKQAIPKYYGFRVGPESSNYTLTYEYYEKQAGSLALDGFSPEEPRPFSTRDHDVHGCVAQRGYMGWYGPNCDGYSLFADVIIWPKKVGVDVEITKATWNMYRLVI
ncbi:hypothetical protein BaRGS_00019266 [Batillaria attramentaria]|uniref:EGF-like domain-containing protein n=1 Tax=Batillaria attramentaria TaxID=370345 RepID=A0ABD0KQF5_9CAEN